MFKHLSNTKKFSFLKLFSAPFSILISGTSCCFSKASVFFSLVFWCLLNSVFAFFFLTGIPFCLLGIPKSFLCIKAFSFLCFFATFKSLFFLFIILLCSTVPTCFVIDSMNCMSSNSELGDVLDNFK